MAATVKNAARERLEAGELALGVILRQARSRYRADHASRRL